MHFTEQLRVKVDKENRMISLSVRIDENNVWTRKITLADFQKMIADFNAQMEESNIIAEQTLEAIKGIHY